MTCRVRNGVSAFVIEARFGERVAVMVGRWVLLDTGIALRTINNVRLTARFLNVAPDRGVAFIRYSRRRLDSRGFEHHVQILDEYHVQITSE